MENEDDVHAAALSAMVEMTDTALARERELWRLEAADMMAADTRRAAEQTAADTADPRSALLFLARHAAVVSSVFAAPPCTRDVDVPVEFAKFVTALAKHGVTKEMILAKLGKAESDVVASDLVNLRGIGRAVRDGQTTIAREFWGEKKGSQDGDGT